MEIKITTTNFSLTPSIGKYLQEKLNGLDKFLSGGEGVFADVELAKTTRHHQKGDIFKAEVNLKMTGRLIRAMAEEWDLRVAIDAVRDELQRQITMNKEKNISLYRKGARLFKRLFTGKY